MWPTSRLIELLEIELPIIQAPMAGASGVEMAAAVCVAGGLGSLPCALLAPDEIAEEVATLRSRGHGAFNLNFFCHEVAQPASDAIDAWRRRLSSYYEELGLDPEQELPNVSRAPFDDEACALVEELRPPVVSFHFGLPAESLLARVRAAGCLVLSSATTVDEARWLAERGCDAVVAQGYEAGGHRGMFRHRAASSQVGTLALVPQVVDAVDVPVIAAGGIADGRGVAAAFALGAAGVQVGTGYLRTAESLVSPLHREALTAASADGTALTDVFTGRLARSIVNRVVRELGPLAEDVPPFPHAAAALWPLRGAAEADFGSLWAGQGVAMVRDGTAAGLTRRLADEAATVLRRIGDE